MKGYTIKVAVTGAALEITVSMGNAEYVLTENDLKFDDSIPADEAAADLNFLGEHLEKLAGFVRLVADSIHSQRN